MTKPRVIIIGGGAAGLSAAIASARMGAAVTLLEAKPRVGTKILATGNGRCNLSNHEISPAAYNVAEFVSPILSEFTSEKIVSFFENLGLLTYADEEGRIYPISNNASSVLDVLRLECAALGVEIICDFKVEKVSQQPHTQGFTVLSDIGKQVNGDSVVVTIGGGEALLADLGHKTVKCEPVLVPIRTDTEPIRGLSGIRVRCSASIFNDSFLQDGSEDSKPVATEKGEILFRDYGVSGIMVFDLSRYLNQGHILSIDFLPDNTLEELIAKLTARRDAFSSRTAETFLVGMFHTRMSAALLRAAHINSKTLVPDIPCDKLARTIKNFTLTITGAGDSKQAQVTRGGVSTDEFSSKTLESQRVAGLFAAGEVLDVDGRCGGYNLHWAWSSGIVAGESAARFALAHLAPRGSSKND